MRLSLAEMGANVLNTADGRAKTALSLQYAEAWQEGRAAGNMLDIGSALAPDHPARPKAPRLCAPKDVAKRKPGSPEGRIALLHAVAHIELNAVDLHWDIIVRFSKTRLPTGFFDDWVQAASEESKHFNLICDCLENLGSFYGALSAHAGMWRAAQDTKTDLLGRLAVVPMVLEARGLDVTPNMIKKFKQAKETQAVEALELIYSEEVTHVAYGSKWFNFLCGRLISDFGGGLPGRWGRCGGVRGGRFWEWIVFALNRTFGMRPRFNRDCFMNDIAFHARRRR